MKRLLCIVGGMNTGGAETFLMKMYRQLDKSLYQMDFCVGNIEECFYDKEIIENNRKIIHITKKSKNPIKSFLDIRKVVKKGQYKSVIRISQHSLSSIDLFAAKLGGAKKLIFRSSNSNSCGNFLNRILHIVFIPLAIIIPNVKIAPSDVAAIHMFGKKQYNKGKVIILNNELNIKKDEFLIGHVGRMVKQKNHFFLIDVFEKYLILNNKSKLLLIGDGELRQQIIDYITDKGLNDKVIMLGVRSDTNELYQAMDCFVFPSLYEGMPNTVIEAQTSGLNCIISNTITKTVNLTDRVKFLNFDNIDEWVANISNSCNRYESAIKVMEKKYDIEFVNKLFIENIF